MLIVIYQIHVTKESANNVSNGIPRTIGTSGNPSTGVLLIRKSCVVSGGGGSCPGTPSFNLHITGNNAQPTSFSLTDGVSQPIALDSGPSQ